MPLHIELSPGSLDQPLYNFGPPLGLSEALSAQFTNRLRYVISDSLVRPTVDIDQLTQEFHDSIDDEARSVFDSRYAHEVRWESETAPVHALLGRLALKNGSISASELVPSESFVQGLHADVDSFQAEIEYLKYLHDIWPPEVFEYLSELDMVMKNESSGRGDKAFELVRKMSDDTERLTLDPSNTEGLLLIPHLPANVRRLTRRLLAGNHITARVGRELGEEITPVEEELLNTLQRYYALDNLHGQHWEEGLALSEDSQVQVARYSAEQLATLITLQETADYGSGQRFKEVWLREAKDLDSEVKSANSKSGVEQWQLTDIGHAFEGFTTFDILRAFRQGMYSYESRRNIDFQPEKSGLKAVILEDDDSQMNLWIETIENSTSFMTEDDLAFVSPEGIEEVADDPTIGLFLLDVQNGEDMTAGIRLAEEILRRRHNLSVQEPANDNMPHRTKIIVWSASSIAVEQANDHFKQLLEEESFLGVSFSIRGLMRGGGGDDTIELEIRPKTFHAYADIE